eukprot:TCALIF_12290-PA protein Name:"Similar to ZFYVE1 Zinc finger FYVE domain-containing protein 1 (Homo sapiens)" AED:0.02 eAED:0.02 QI:61/1/1/1/1/0.75/4/514/657
MSGLASSMFNSALPDVLTSELQTLNLHADEQPWSFTLLNDHEQLCVDTPEAFAAKLGCLPEQKAKVVAIVGNAGEGKSFTLNHVFFDGQEIFPTSADPHSGTLGVSAVFQPCQNLLVLDTEGFLGQGHENRRTRQLLKVLAVSDIVIVKTQAERLHNDLFHFLGDAAKAYEEHFSAELKRVSQAIGRLGPLVIIFHETRHTAPLKLSEAGLTPEDQIRRRILAQNQDVSAFSRLVYFGHCHDPEANDQGSTVFERLLRVIANHAADTSMRSPRPVSLIFRTIQVLNEKFRDDIVPTHFRSFPDEYFTCTSKCSCCEQRCTRAINHKDEHYSKENCSYVKSRNNKLYMCRRCFEDGRREMVVPKAGASEEGSLSALASYAWSGDVLECSRCGVIYRSRQHWYGNDTPESKAVVHTEVSHMWPGTRTLQGTHNAARRMLDGVSQIGEMVSQITAVPKKSAADWVANQVNPPYWTPNSVIVYCHGCRYKFTPNSPIHHCRACGEGFCDACSDFQRPVPEKGWPEPVRSCRQCYTSYQSTTRGSSSSSSSGGRYMGGGDSSSASIQTRRMGEKVVGSISTFASMFQYPINVMKDSARPEYWVPDDEIEECVVCRVTFDGRLLSIHHCRQCGHGVCESCSKTKKPVPARGWDQPVRVCDTCV